jgi:AcrR family transcriptional regulator
MPQPALTAVPSSHAPARVPDATRERLLSAAAQLFSERGFVAMSMRAVTQAAGVSVSAANYHFGSKQALLEAVCEHHIALLNEQRMVALDAVAEAFAPDAPPLEEVLHAFLGPLFEHSGPGLQECSRAIAARLYADPPEVAWELREALFGPLRLRMLALLARSLPESTPAQLGLALQFTVGALVHSASGNLERVSEPAGPAPNDAWTLELMVDYCAAGMRAVAARTSPEGAG